MSAAYMSWRTKFINGKRHRSDKVTTLKKKLEDKKQQAEKEAASILKLQTATKPKKGWRVQLDKTQGRHAMGAPLREGS